MGAAFCLRYQERTGTMSVTEFLVGVTVMWLCGFITGVCFRLGGEAWRQAALSWAAAFKAWRDVFGTPEGGQK